MTHDVIVVTHWSSDKVVSGRMLEIIRVGTVSTAAECHMVPAVYRQEAGCWGWRVELDTILWRSFHNHGESLYYGLLLVESAY